MKQTHGNIITVHNIFNMFSFYKLNVKYLFTPFINDFITIK